MENADDSPSDGAPSKKAKLNHDHMKTNDSDEEDSSNDDSSDLKEARCRKCEISLAEAYYRQSSTVQSLNFAAMMLSVYLFISKDVSYLLDRSATDLASPIRFSPIPRSTSAFDQFS